MTKLSQIASAVYIFVSVGLIGSAKAESVNFGSWFVDVSKSGGFLYAATVNDSGNFFGQYCYPGSGSCMWFLGMKVSCKEGEQYPVLVNSDVGSNQLQLLCTGKLDNSLYRYAFTDFDAVDEVVKKGLRVGFAAPLQSDQFTVIRFNLDGSNRAVAGMREVASQVMPSNTVPASGNKSTHDETM
ncbi:hypothetical protein IVG45_21180 [Methylomonas sp. LL1]|uniref:hypothetical protein n=1 Tax=Methylomonas sp. LL1 TaxID=2785785 RepID=UPI0018C417B3|nr:hypothetical protein [Methylomonas sp. LL1]QPK63285.1 hypothetical protein IVG45_21180 [Methylomonas sp. LL1]